MSVLLRIEVPLEGVEVVGPQPAVRLQPRVELVERLTVQALNCYRNP
ncbi:hypothetical protein [Rhodococcus jostii]